MTIPRRQRAGRSHGRFYGCVHIFAVARGRASIRDDGRRKKKEISILTIMTIENIDK
jgi:hypothetical protein